jgi:hypothetical protein
MLFAHHRQPLLSIYWTVMPEKRRLVVEEALETWGNGALFFDGLDAAIVGMGQQFTDPALVVYDEGRILKILMDQGMDWDEAFEFYSFNIAGSWVGENTPIIVTRWEEIEGT